MTRTERDQADRRLWTACLLILTTIAIGVALYLLRPVLLPFVLALFFTYCLTPVIELQMRYLGIPRGVALVGTGILGLLLLALFVLLVATTAASIADNFGRYQDEFTRVTEKIIGALSLDKVDPHADVDIRRTLSVPKEDVHGLISSLVGEVTAIISNGVLVLIFMIFILLGRQAGPRHPTGLLGEVETRVKRYVVRMVLFSILTGVLVGLTLAVLGVEYAWVFGFLAFLLNFIPNVGAIIATLLPLPVVLLSPDLSLTAQVLAVAVPGTLQFLIGIVQPKVMGGSLGLHPVTVLMALIFFGMIWGIVGAFLATPITAALKIVLERIPATRPLAALMEGNLEMLSRPASEQLPLPCPAESGKVPP
jgi:AI-2 transport protein TqsA